MIQVPFTMSGAIGGAAIGVLPIGAGFVHVQPGPVSSRTSSGPQITVR